MTQPPPLPPAAVLETTLYAEDLDAAERFYSELLGLAVRVRVPGRHVFFRIGDAMLLVFDPRETIRPADGPVAPPPHGASGSGHVCFVSEADALDRWRTLFVAEGVAVEADFRWPNGARSIYVRDPAGNSVEFAESQLWFG